MINGGVSDIPNARTRERSKRKMQIGVHGFEECRVQVNILFRILAANAKDIANADGRTNSAQLHHSEDEQCADEDPRGSGHANRKNLSGS
mmetsp:Transcript_40283/g.97250  ORF Transcript_40283/g.97250 Transcript_40283/m.97250 type:complete len:90 (+) Transcript_40283:384-653(+)